MTATIVLLLISQFSPIPQYELPVLQDLRPIRTVDYGHHIINDIEQHMPPQHIYRDNDKITWAHETTHGLDAEIFWKKVSTGIDYQELRDKIGKEWGKAWSALLFK